MSLPLQKRDYDVFLSHAHKDQVFVSALDTWLRESAGFKVWYDARELAGGAQLATDLQQGIERCRAAFIVATDEALARGWVKAEYNSVMDERANYDGFRVVALRVGNAKVDGLMRGVSWIDVPPEGLDLDAALAVLHSFYPGERRPNPATSRDVYVSCSWHQDDGASARGVCSALVEQGFRLIGDAKDQKGFGTGDRVERLIASCGAFVGIVPFRGAEEAKRGEKPYKYFLREMDFAAGCGIPSVIVADPRIRCAEGQHESWLPMDTSATQCAAPVCSALETLWEEWDRPPNPQYLFWALDLESDAARPSSKLRHLIERVTGLETVVGDEIHQEPLHSAIVKAISQAFVVLADLTDDNVNTCIEAGMGLATGANVELIARGKPRRPPFMLRTLQMPTYSGPVEQAAILHRILRPYRRRVINAEL